MGKNLRTIDDKKDIASENTGQKCKGTTTHPSTGTTTSPSSESIHATTRLKKHNLKEKTGFQDKDKTSPSESNGSEWDETEKRKTGRRILKNFISLSGANIICKALAFISTAYLARVLNAEGFGILGFAQAVIVYFQLLLNQGLDTYGTREIARSSEDIPRYVNNILTIRLILSIISYFLLALVTFLIPKPPIVKGVILILGLKLFEIAFNIKWVFQGTERMEWIGISRIVQQLLFVAGVLLLIKKPEQILSVPVLQVSTGAVGVIALLHIYRKGAGKIRLEVDIPFWKKIFAQSIPMAASYLLIQIYLNFDMLLLGFTHSDRTVGLYNAAYRVITIINIFGLYYFTTLFPNISRMYLSSRNRMRQLLSKSLKSVILIAVPLCVGGTILARPMITFIFGNDFAMSALPFKILIWNVAVIWISLHYGNTLIACNRQKQYLVGVTIGAASNIILNIIFIPRYGMTAAAITTVFSELIVLWFMYHKLNLILRLSFLKLLPKPLLASAIMGTVLYFLPAWHVAALVAIGILVYFPGAVAVGALKREELVSIYHYLIRRENE